ncbi:MAG: putative holin-like toxin [Tumebacillaceae bacterium]
MTVYESLMVMLAFGGFVASTLIGVFTYVAVQKKK